MNKGFFVHILKLKWKHHELYRVVRGEYLCNTFVSWPHRKYESEVGIIKCVIGHSEEF